MGACRCREMERGGFVLIFGIAFTVFTVFTRGGLSVTVANSRSYFPVTFSVTETHWGQNRGFRAKVSGKNDIWVTYATIEREWAFYAGGCPERHRLP